MKPGKSIGLGRLVAALMLGTALVPTLPMTAAMAQEAARDFRIPAQPLDDALMLYGRQAGMMVSVDAALLRGLRSPGVSGTLPPGQALQRVLAGSGLSWRQSGATMIVSRPGEVAADGSVQLDTITIQAGGKTEGTGSWTTTDTSATPGLPLSIRETPKSVSVVTRQQMDDFGMRDLNDALKSDSSIYLETSNGQTTAPISRGFAMQGQIDGVPGDGMWSGNANIGSTRDMAFIDRVEVLQGAAGLSTGAGAPGGTINLIRKRPTQEFQSSIEAEAGSWSAGRVVADVSGPLNESGSIRGRLVGMADKRDSFVDYISDEKEGVYGVVEADIAPNTVLGASVMYTQRDWSAYRYGVPLYRGKSLGFGRDTFFGGANDGNRNDETHYTAYLEHTFANDWKLNATAMHKKMDMRLRLTYFNFAESNLDAVTGEGKSYGTQPLDYLTHQNILSVQTSGPVQAFGRTHDLAFGASWSKTSVDGAFRYDFMGPFNIYDFDPKAYPRPQWGDPQDYRWIDTKEYGVFAAANLNVSDRLKVLLGARWSWYDQTNRTLNVQTGRDSTYGSSSTSESGVFAPYAGVVYDLTSQWSAYASYSEIFAPQTQIQADGSIVKPVTGSNYEIGLKGELFNGGLNTALALFRTEETNRAVVDDSVTDPVLIARCGGRSCYRAAGEIISQGVDLSASGEVMANLHIGAGYTYTDAEYGNGTPGFKKGDAYRTTMPAHALRLFATYDIPDTGWSVGGSIRSQSDTYNTYKAGADTYRVTQGGYTLVGLMAKYKFDDNLNLSLRVDNLFDKTYADTYSNTNLYYGEPRRITASLKYTF
ncbi:TonB-dependent siderophore receptor [Paenirhodobacter sp.]|uniref:TonB-dependent siderophore receptor n=1 Tax=Paenirhodobacter sp. TaxID=1965326 RepID=UPI003B40E168